jgi:hypothetical protein
MFRHLPTLLALVIAAPLLANDRTRLVAANPSRLVLEGSSNVAAWRCSGTTLEGGMEVAASLSEIGDIGEWIASPTFRLRIPVTTLRCGNGRMERDMYRALRSQSHPSIDFRFVHLAGTVREGANGTYHAKIAGVVSLAGATRNVVVDVEAKRIAPDRIRLRAKLPLRMTDFCITPPTALFGAIKANDDLVVHFDLVLGIA